MIELKGSRFTDILPEHLRTTESKALAYVVGRQVEQLLAWAEAVPFYTAVTSAPDSILDHLAVELRTPAYDQMFSLPVKRQLILDSLLAYAKMGTPAAIDRILTAIFGAGNIEEWFDYEGEPHHFRALIQVRNSITEESLEEFRRILGRIKRLSSWLDGIITVTPFDPAPVEIAPGAGGYFSSSELPYCPVPVKPTVLQLSPGIGGFASVIHPPELQPVFQGGMTYFAVPHIGGRLTITTLPPVPRPIRVAARSSIGGTFSVMELPEIERGG